MIELYIKQFVVQTILYKLIWWIELDIFMDFTMIWWIWFDGFYYDLMDWIYGYLLVSALASRGLADCWRLDGYDHSIAPRFHQYLHGMVTMVTGVYLGIPWSYPHDNPMRFSLFSWYIPLYPHDSSLYPHFCCSSFPNEISGEFFPIIVIPPIYWESLGIILGIGGDMGVSIVMGVPQ